MPAYDGAFSAGVTHRERVNRVLPWPDDFDFVSSVVSSWRLRVVLRVAKTVAKSRRGQFDGQDNSFN